MRHQAEQHHRGGEDRQGEQDDGLAPAHAEGHHAPYALVERGCVRIVAFAACAVLVCRFFGQVRQQFFADQRYEHYRGDPGRDERNGDHLEDRTGVFAGTGIGSGDRQETRRGDQRAGQHRERRAGPGEAGGLEAVVTLLHLDRHHLHRNDRVIHHQPEGQDQGAEGDLVQADVQIAHGGKGHCQHQRNRQRDHQPGTHA